MVVAGKRINSLLERIKAKLRIAPHEWSTADIDRFVDDFVDNTDALAKFESGVLDVEVWKKFASIGGETRAWVRKSVALQNRIKAKGFTDADVDRLKNYYNRHRSNGDVTTYPSTSSTGIHYDAFGHPDFTDFIKKIRKKDGTTLGRPVYEPSGGITGNRATDASRANAEMAANFHQDDIKYTLGSNECRIRDPSSPYAEPDGFVTCTWHHHQDGKTMMAVPKPVHSSTNATHIGGIQTKEEGIAGFFDSPIFSY